MEIFDILKVRKGKGYENPNYTNINFPYPCDISYVPDDNPCGVYEREFVLDKKWGRVYFVLEGVSSCAFLTVNDQYIGSNSCGPGLEER